MVWDAVLEYRVWLHPERGAPDEMDGNDYFRAFASYEDAFAFARETRGAEAPLALVLQREFIAEPENGMYVHVRTERVAEWAVTYLSRPQRTERTIPDFLAPDAPPNRLDILRGRASSASILARHLASSSELGSEAPVDFSKVGTWEDYSSACEPDQLPEGKNLLDTARGFLTRFQWCRAVTEEYVGILIEDSLGVFLFRFEPGRVHVPEWTWVVVGNLPPAYIIVEADTRNPACALDGYIGAMQEWVDAVTEGRPVDSLIPVNVPASRESAESLQHVLNQLDEDILSSPAYQEDLKAGAGLPSIVDRGWGRV